jgi:HlyD family secretion protein
MIRRRGLVFLVLLGLASGAAALLLRSRGEPVQVAAVRRGPLRVVIACAGVLQPPPGGELRAREPAIVAASLVTEGARVTRHEPLVQLSDPELVMRERQAREEVLQLGAEAAAAAEEAERADREAQHQRRRTAADRRLVDEGAIAPASAAASQLALQDAEARLAAARARLTALRGPQPDAGGSSRLALARARAGDLAERVAALTLRAPADGVVYGLPRREGEAVAAGQLVASVTDPDRPHVRIKVDQPDLPRLEPGQGIVVSFDGLPDQRWEGSLDGVSRGLRDAGGREVAEVLGSIRDPEHLLPWNASVNVEVVVLSRPAVLQVPRAALRREGDRRFVYLAQDGHARRREVKLGSLATNEAEIESGLSEGEWVVLSGSVPLRDGARIQVTRP